MTGVSLIPQVAVLGADYFARFDTLTTDSAADDDLVADFESDGLRVVQA